MRMPDWWPFDGLFDPDGVLFLVFVALAGLVWVAVGMGWLK